MILLGQIPVQQQDRRPSTENSFRASKLVILILGLEDKGSTASSIAAQLLRDHYGREVRVDEKVYCLLHL